MPIRKCIQEYPSAQKSSSLFRLSNKTVTRHRFSLFSSGAHGHLDEEGRDGRLVRHLPPLQEPGLHPLQGVHRQVEREAQD